MECAFVVTPEVFTAAGTWALALITIALVKSSTNDSRDATAALVAESKKASMLALFSQQVEHYQSVMMRRLRRSLAQDLFVHYGKNSLEPVRLIQDETVMEFFENLGRLTKDDHLDVMLVRNYFSEAVLCYWNALRDEIVELRKGHEQQDVYVDFEWLNEKLAWQGQDGTVREKVDIPTAARRQAFLESERRLIDISILPNE